MSFESSRLTLGSVNKFWILYEVHATHQCQASEFESLPLFFSSHLWLVFELNGFIFWKPCVYSFESHIHERCEKVTADICLCVRTFDPLHPTTALYKISFHSSAWHLFLTYSYFFPLVFCNFFLHYGTLYFTLQRIVSFLVNTHNLRVDQYKPTSNLFAGTCTGLKVIFDSRLQHGCIK